MEPLLLMKHVSECYKHKLEELFSRDKKWGLETFKEVLTAYNHPEKQFKTLHIGGSNGKGSVATKIAKALEKEGYKTGLYTSPHISCFRERIQINGAKIPEEAVVRLLPDEKEGSFFELTTLLMFRWFAEEKVDWAVIEVGLGGRLDATNVISPELAVITSISFEHTEILGSSLTEIAYEKGGILKPQIPAIVGPRAAYYPQAEVVSGPFAHYDEENSAIAKRALEKLPISPAAIAYGLAQRPPCRFERLGTRIILDVAHNPDGMQELVRWLGTQKAHIVLAMSKNKDIDASLQILNQAALSYIATEAKNPHHARALEATQLGQKIIASGFPQSKIEVIPSPQEALKAALQKSGLILVTGTFFIMDEIKKGMGSVISPLHLDE